MKPNNGFVLLNGAAAAGAGTPVDVELYSHFVAYFVTTGTTGGTLRLEALDPLGNWVVIHEEVLTGAISKPVQFSGAFKKLRGNVATYTNGTHSLSVDCNNA